MHCIPRYFLAILVLLCAASVSLSAAYPSQEKDASKFIKLALANPENAFKSWTEAFQRSYESESEYRKKLGVFASNALQVSKLSSENPKAKFALNEFADLTWEEFSSTRLGLKATPEYLSQRAVREPEVRRTFAKRLSTPPPSSNSTVSAAPQTSPPVEVDWRTSGIVTGVKNQGTCGSCWAFSATGAIEAANALTTGTLVSLSEQQLVDCDVGGIDAGCGGGLMDEAFKYVEKNGGIDTEMDWGYYSVIGFGTWCNRRKEKDRHVVSIQGFEDVPQDEAALKKAVARQPVAVGICATVTLQFYDSGVLTSCCSGINHGVLAVGYKIADDASSSSSDSTPKTALLHEGDDSNDGPYWIIKNSWGSSWGERGYFRVRAMTGDKGLCHIAEMASYPVKTQPNEPTRSVCDPFAWTECPVGSSCDCKYSFLGFFCLWHDCCPLEDAVGCPDRRHCCPAGTTCDASSQGCLTANGTIIAWTSKTDALVDDTLDTSAMEKSLGGLRVGKGLGKGLVGGDGAMASVRDSISESLSAAGALLASGLTGDKLPDDSAFLLTVDGPSDDDNRAKDGYSDDKVGLDELEMLELEEEDGRDGGSSKGGKGGRVDLPLLGGEEVFETGLTVMRDRPVVVVDLAQTAGERQGSLRASWRDDRSEDEDDEEDEEDEEDDEDDEEDEKDEEDGDEEKEREVSGKDVLVVGRHNVAQDMGRQRTRGRDSRREEGERRRFKKTKHEEEEEEDDDDEEEEGEKKKKRREEKEKRKKEKKKEKEEKKKEKKEKKKEKKEKKRREKEEKKKRNGDDASSSSDQEPRLSFRSKHWEERSSDLSRGPLNRPMRVARGGSAIM